MKTVFVTGAGGFIGRALCEDLVRLGITVRALVRRQGSEVAGVEYIFGTLEDGNVIRRALKGVDCVIHLAGRAHQLNDSSKKPLEEFRRVNRDATIGLAKICLSQGVKRFIFISSIGVNGSNPGQVVISECSGVFPDKDYALSKLEAERGLKLLFSDTATELVIIRPPLVYGGKAPGNFMRLLKLVHSGLPLPFGAVQNQRSMISLRNFTSFILICIHHPLAANELFLISDGVNISLPDMLRCLSDGMGQKVRLINIPVLFLYLCAGFMRKKSLVDQLCGSFLVDSSKAGALLGWKAPHDVHDELARAGKEYIKH